jgi:uncharacterized protein
VSISGHALFGGEQEETSMTTRCALLVLSMQILTLGACSTPSRLQSMQPPQRDISAPSSPLKRGQIVPLIDHHQHIFSSALVDPPTAVLPEVPLPPPLRQLLRERERISGTREVDGIFAPDAAMLNTFFDTDYWVSGSARIANVVEERGRGLRFVPNSFHLSGSAAFISGIVFADDKGEYDHHFSLGLRRNGGGWKIASEAITEKVDNPFRHPLDASMLIDRLDDAGIQRAVVLSTAFWLANPRRKPDPAEQMKVREANDWVIAQSGLYPERLVPFCSVNPLSDYALAELRRCAAIPRVSGMKLHFANGQVDLKKPEHLARVQEFFRAANAAKLAIVVHLWPRGAEGPDYSQIFIEQVMSQAPEIPVQIAHMASGAPAVFESTLAVFADALQSADRRVSNLYVDVTEIITEDTPQALVDALTKRMRQIGLNRILFGSDTPLPRYRPPPVQAWATFRRRVPLSDDELRVIAENVAPYMP